MDFKLILLLLGLGHLVVVVLYALWGFFGGLKRELKCTAVLLILLLLGWLIFSDPAMMMGIQLPGNLLSSLSSLGVEAQKASIWEVVLQVLQAQVPNGSALFVEGREAYELAYDVVAGVLRGVGLIVITLGMLYLSGLIRLVSHIVKLIVTAVKKAKAKNALPVEAEEALTEEEEPEQVVVLGGIEGGDDVVVTTDVNELPAPKPITQRIWGAVVGLVKACFVLCITFVPLSGIVSILDQTSDETRDLISDLVSGEEKLVEGEESSNAVDIVFDFVEDYKSSPLGLCVESTSYFFGDSFSTLLFDSLFFVSTDAQKIPLRTELVTFIHAVNALEGSLDYKNFEQDKLSNALDELKESQLLPEIMPVAIEFAYETEQVKEALIAANQEALFLQLRYVDWDKDLEKILDAVKVVYSLDIFAEDFNYLTLEVSSVRTIVELLSSTEFLPKALPVAVKVAIKLDAVQNLIQNPNFNPDVKNIDWVKDLNLLVDVYEDFQKIGITSFEGLDKDAILDKVFNKDANVQAVKDIISSLVHMDLFTTVLAPAGECIVDAKMLEINKGQFKSLVGVLPIKDLTAEQWESDLHTLVDLADKFYDLDVFGFEIVNMDLTSPEAIEAFKFAIDKVFGTLGENSQNGLHILRQDDALLKIIDWAFKNFDLVALDAELSIDSSSVSLPKEGAVLKELIDVYADLAKYPEFDINNMKFDFLALLEKDDMGEIVTRALEAIVESDIILNTLVPILEHKVVPLVSKYEGAEDLVTDIINANASESPAEIINELSKIIQAVFSAKDLGLLAVPRDGLKAIDFAKTDEMKAVINAVLDTKLFEGFEARIIKVLLKIAKIDVELSDLEGIDFDSEKVLINSFIDQIAPVLQDERFEIFNDENKIVFSDEFKSLLFSQEGAHSIVNGLQVLFGDYEAGTTGSQLVPTLLLPLYDQFLADKLPESTVELMEIIDIKAFTAEELAHDITALVYVAEQLIDFEILSLVQGKPEDITFEAEEVLDNIDKMFAALKDVNILNRRFAELLAYGVNTVVDKYNEKQVANGKNQIIVRNLFAKDFSGVDAGAELDLIAQALKQAVEVLNNNKVTSVAELKDFINDKGYLARKFLTEENAYAIIKVIEPIAKLEILPPIVKAADKQIYLTVANLGLNIDHSLNLENEQITEDLLTIVGILRKAVKLGALELVYAKDLSDIDYEIIASVLYDENGADLSDLNILQESQVKLMSEIISFAISKVAPKSDFTITPSDLKNTDVVNDFNQLSQIVLVLGEMIDGLGLESLSDIKAFAKDLKAKELLKNQDLINEANVDRVCEILALVSEMTYFEAISPVALNEVIMALAKKEASIETLYGSVSGADLAEDLKALSTLGQAVKDAKIVEFILGKSVYSINEEAFAQIVETVLNTNIVNNNNIEIIKIVVGIINKTIEEKVPALKGFSIDVETYLFEAFTEKVWAMDHKLFAEIVAHALRIAFDELGIVSINSINEFINDKEFKYIEFYTAELVEEVGCLLSDLIALHTVGALLPSVFDYAIDIARKAEVKGQELGLDFLYILEAYDKGELTNQMIAQDVITLVFMAVELIDNGTIIEINRAIKNKSFNDMELQLDKYVDAIKYLGELNILTIDSAKFTTQLVNLLFRLAKLEYQAVEKDFVHLTAKDWYADSVQLTEVLVNANAVLEHLDENAGLVVTINGIKDFFKNDAKQVNEYLTPELIAKIEALAQSALSFNAGEKLIGNVVDFLLPVAQEKLRDKAQFASIELDFLQGTVSQATLHDDVAVIAQILIEAIEFGLYEYMETKDIAKLELVHIAHIVDLFGELNLYNQAREGWYVNAALVASDTTKKNFILSYEDLEGINFEEDNEQLQAVIMQIDALLKENKHESLGEVINFVKDLGATYEQWATPQNGKAIVEILNGLADVDILMVCGASSIEYVIYFALTKNIDIRFLYDLPYKGADLGADIKLIASMLDEALEFGALELIWKYPIEKIDLSHIQNIVKYADQLHIFGLDKASWTALAANLIGKKVGINVAVEAEMFAHVDWAKENAAVVDLIGKAQEILDNNKFESTTELNKFIKEAAYLSNQYVTEENFELIAQALDILAELDVLEVLLPGLAEFGMDKLQTGVSGDFTTVTSKEFTTLAYMIREALAFGTVEMYNNILWNEKYFYEGEFDLTHVINIVKALEELDILAVDKAHLAQFVASKLKLATNVDFSVYEAIDYSAENAKLVEIIETIDALMQSTYLTNLEFIYHWVDEKGYQSAQYITDENALLVADLLQSVSELQLLVPYGKELSNKAFDKVSALNYLSGAYEGEQLVEDLANIATIVRDLVEFDTIDLFYWQSTPEFKFDALREAIDLALNLNILNVKRAETMALVLNKVMPALGISASYDATDFANVDFAKDDATILAAYDQLVMLFNEMNIDNTTMLDAYINDRLFMLAQYTNEITIEYAVEFIDLIADLDQLEIVIDEVALLAISKLKGFDLSFVANAIEAGELTAEELVADIHKLVEIADGFLEYELYDMIYSNDYKEVDTDKFVEIFVKFDEMHVFNELRPEWTVAIVNKLFGKFVTISQADLAHITDEMWADEIDALAHTIVYAYDYLVIRGYADNAEFNRLYNELVKEKKYEDKLYLIDLLFNDAYGEKDEYAVSAFVTIFLRASMSDVSGVVLHEAFTKVINNLNSKGIDLTKLPEMISISELQQDMFNVCGAAYGFVMFGGLELVIEKGVIDYNKLYYIYEAVELLLSTNVANKDSGYLMGGILKDEASRTTGYFSEELYLKDKAEAIINIIDEIAYIARIQEFNTLQEIIDFVKDPKSHELIVSSQFNSALLALANALDIIGNDVFFTESILAGARGHLSTLLDKYHGLLDIYMIYTGQTLAEDIDSVSNAIVALCDLDIYAILLSDQVIPYGRVDIVETVLTELLGLHYLNDPHRIEEIIEGIGSLTNTDLSSLADMNLDLPGDAIKLTAMYQELLAIFESPEWPYEYISDFKTEKLSLQFVLSANFKDACVAAFNQLKVTSIYEETNGAILVVLLPIFKVALPEYYDALNFENCTLEDLVNDFSTIFDAVHRVLESDLLEGIKDTNATVDFNAVATDVDFILDSILNVKLLQDGSLKAIIELLLGDFIYGKSVNGSYMPYGLFKLNDVSFEQDFDLISQIVAELAAILTNSNVTSLAGISGLAQADKLPEVIMNEENIISLTNIISLLSESTFLEANFVAVWNDLVVPTIELTAFNPYAQFMSYEGASNAQMIEDLDLIAQIILAIKDLGIVEIYEGQEIDYAQASELEEILTLISQLNYFEFNKEALYDLISYNITNIGGLMFAYDEFTLIEDLPKFARVYAEIVPFFMAPAFPYTTLNDYKEIISSGSIAEKDTLIQLAYNHRNDFADAYRVGAEEDLEKYVLIFSLPVVKALLPEYYTALNLTGYTYADLQSDVDIAKEIYLRVCHSQIAVILTNNDTAIIDYDRALADVEFIAESFFDIQILSKGNLEDILQIAVKDLVNGKEINGTSISNFRIDLTNVNLEEDVNVLIGIAEELVIALQDCGFNTFGQIKSILDKNTFNNVVFTEENIEVLANVVEHLGELTLVQNNIANTWSGILRPLLSATVAHQYVAYEGATNEHFIEDIYVLADIIRALNKLGIDEINRGGAIDYDKYYELQDVLELVAQLNYFELDKDIIFNIIYSKVSGLGIYNVTPEQLEIQEDLVKLADVYRELLPILTSPEYPFTTLKTYAEMLVYGVSDKAALVELINDNKQVLVATYSALLELDIVKYCAIDAYKYAYAATGNSDLVALFDLSSLTLEEVEEDLLTLVEVLEDFIACGINFGYEDGKVGILASSEINFGALDILVKDLYELNCLEGDLDAIVDIATSKVDLSLDGTYVADDKTKAFISEIFQLAIAFEDELGFNNLGEMLDYYKDMNNTVELVMSNQNLQGSIVHFISKAALSNLGQDLVSGAYNKFAKPALPEDYKDFINFEDPTYTPDKWAQDFQNIFAIYNKLEELDYGTSFVPTMSEVSELYSMLFGAYTAPYSVAKDPQPWLERIFFNNLPAFGGFTPDYANVIYWNVETEKIGDVLDALTDLLGEDKQITSLSVSDFYKVEDVDTIEALLTSVNNSITMRSLINIILDEAVSSNSNQSAMINLSDLRTSSPAIWTPEEIEKLAEMLVIANAVAYDEDNNFDPSAFDFTNVNKLGQYYEDAINDDGTVDTSVVGLGHLLIALQESAAFSLKTLGGKDGLIAKQINGFADVENIGDINDADDIREVLDVICAIQVVTGGTLDGTTPTHVYNEIEDPAVLTMIVKIQQSSVLQSILPELVDDLFTIKCGNDKSAAIAAILLVPELAPYAPMFVNPSEHAENFYTIKANILVDTIALIKTL